MTGSQGVREVTDGVPGLADRLWNRAVTPEDYVTAAGEKYQAAVLEQYRLYVEMADRVSARRSLTNTFFLTVNATLIAMAGAFGSSVLKGVSVWGVVPIGLIAVCQCAVWFLLILSYKQLNGAKYRVIGELERRLPALPYRDAEWLELGEGKSWRRYVPLTRVELGVPAIFAALYLLIVVAALISR
ncbi:hypothetical protein HDA32_005126 [Spinactinospora alkalitolerans]|uniref:Small integral membrane protein n=1 Tax=Spinactinospora alkalitolerans TaxID=687207 RepID=A0A852TZK8_9ACTN|nr:hypothetical protein [Spinactinospora alkalitolerans]NYE50006.1 hypothetical protein [Spinactinospora alkalitolerans]